MALRQALGAGRARLVLQMLTESVVLSAGGALAGLTTAYYAIRGLLRRLLETRVEFIIVGGLAGNVHGSARATIRHRCRVRVVAALAPISPYLRGAPPGPPFVVDTATIQRGLNFMLATALGDLDLLGEVAGGAVTRG